MENPKNKILILGALLGAVAGLVAAVVLMQRAEEAHQNPRLTAGDGVKVGLGVLGVLKLISDIGTRK